MTCQFIDVDLLMVNIRVSASGVTIRIQQLLRTYQTKISKSSILKNQTSTKLLKG